MLQSFAVRAALALLGVLTIVWCTGVKNAAAENTAAGDVPTIPPPASWNRFVILVWQYQTDVSKDRALYESVNLHGFHIDRENAGLEKFAAETKWPFYVDHTADKGYLHLGNRAGEVLKKRDIVIRPNSLADPATVEKMKGFIKRNVTSALGSPVVAYSLDDEVSLGSFCSPSEVDGGALSVAGYRKFLQAMYGSIDKLNAQYGTQFKDFEAIKPASYEAFRMQLGPTKLGQLNFSQWCDWHSYMDTQFADCLADLTRYANSLDPKTPTGFVGGQGPDVWGGYDYRKLCKAVQWMEAYDIGGNNEILRSFWDQKHAHVQTYFSSKDPRSDSWFLWYYLCHGNRGMIAWPEGWFKDGKVAPHIQANAATFKEVQGDISTKIIDGKFVHDPVAIYYSQPSIQMTWALDAASHQGTWPNRSSSMESDLSTSCLTRIGWLKTLEDIGIQGKFIHQDHLLDGALEKDGYKALVLNRTLCLSDEEAAAIRKFAAEGGMVIADHLCGIFDEHGKARAHGALDDLFGVRRDLSQGILGGDTLTEVDGEKGGSFSEKTWSVQGSELRDGMPIFERGLFPDNVSKQASTAIIRKGNCIYLNLSPIGYLLERPKGKGQEWTKLIAGILKEGGIEPRLTLAENGQPSRELESIFWDNGDRTTLCIVKNLSRRASVDSFGSTGGGLGDKPIKLKLTFAKPIKDLVNERTGAKLGSQSTFDDDFTPWEANVYTFQK